MQQFKLKGAVIIEYIPEFEYIIRKRWTWTISWIFCWLYGNWKQFCCMGLSRICYWKLILPVHFYFFNTTNQKFKIIQLLLYFIECSRTWYRNNTWDYCFSISLKRNFEKLATFFILWVFSRYFIWHGLLEMKNKFRLYIYFNGLI